uniref:DnaJ homolog subfamily B member 9 n=1 Tax=Parastrongyloides trichosuri TaxID=131310 RepID=A0A0N4ZG98_PARTI
MAQRKNYYEILNISEKATKKEIKKAFRDMALKYHPDKNSQGMEKFVEVSEAFHVLYDDVKKFNYDRMLQLKKNSSTTFFSRKTNFFTNDYKCFGNVDRNENLVNVSKNRNKHEFFRESSSLEESVENNTDNINAKKEVFYNFSMPNTCDVKEDANESIKKEFNTRSHPLFKNETFDKNCHTFKDIENLNYKNRYQRIRRQFSMDFYNINRYNKRKYDDSPFTCSDYSIPNKKPYNLEREDRENRVTERHIYSNFSNRPRQDLYTFNSEHLSNFLYVLRVLSNLERGDPVNILNKIIDNFQKSNETHSFISSKVERLIHDAHSSYRQNIGNIQMIADFIFCFGSLFNVDAEMVIEKLTDLVRVLNT